MSFSISFKRSVFITLSLALVTTVINTFAQTTDRVNFVFQGFQKPDYLRFSKTIEILDERMLVKLVSIKKFNVIKRDALLWKSIEEELKIQDFIHPSTAIKLGSMLGARYYLEGRLTEISSNQYDQSTGKVFKAIAEASLNLINLETGKYEVSVTSKQHATDIQYDASFQKVINSLVDDLAAQLSNEFPITATIKSIEGEQNVKIDKGFLDGVEVGRVYKLEDIDDASVKIMETSGHEATGRIVTGMAKFNVGQKIKETKTAVKSEVVVTKKKKDIVFIDGGKNLGIKRGDIFVTKKESQLDIGSKIVIEEQVVARVYILDVKNDYSKAKIYKGFHDIKAGSRIVAADEGQSYRAGFLSLGYKHALSQNIKGNAYSGIVTVENESGSYNIDTEYNRNLKSLKGVSIYSLTFSTRQLVRGTTTSLNIDIYNIGGNELKTWIPSFEVTYDKALFPERMYWMVGGSIGYGRMKQYLPNSATRIISNGKSSFVKDNALPGSIITGFQFLFQKFRVTTALSYDFLKFSHFSYDYRNDNPEGETSATAPDEIVPYPVIDLSGLYVEGTISYQLWEP